MLRARLRALIARSELVRRSRLVEVRSLHLDTDTREARYSGQPIELTNMEFTLLALLAREPHAAPVSYDGAASEWSSR